jgi:hypothetical protein
VRVCKREDVCERESNTDGFNRSASSDSKPPNKYLTVYVLGGTCSWFLFCLFGIL